MALPKHSALVKYLFGFLCFFQTSLAGFATCGGCWHLYRQQFCREVLGLAAHTAFVPYSAPVAGMGASARLIGLYAICTGVCAGSLAVPLGLCFADGTLFEAQSQGGVIMVPVEALVPGQRVRTLEDGVLSWTRVMSNDRRKADEPFVMIKATSGNVTNTLTVTPGHIMPSSTGASSFAGSAVVTAEQLGLGDTVFVFEAATETQATIEAVGRIAMAYKNTLRTESGTVLANNFITTTICDELPTSHTFANMSAMLATWRATHSMVWA
jgi:hypothetical protein